MIAWNIHVTGRQELADCAFAGSKLDAEQQAMVRKEIAGLVQRKIELYPRQMTAIRDVAATLVNGSPRATLSRNCRKSQTMNRKSRLVPKTSPPCVKQ